MLDSSRENVCNLYYIYHNRELQAGSKGGGFGFVGIEGILEL